MAWADVCPQAKPRTGHHTVQPVGNPRADLHAHRSSPHPEPKASGIPAHGSTMGEKSAPPTRCPKPSPERGINHASPWGRHGVRPTAAVPRARMNRRHTRSHPEPKASGIPAHGSTMGEKSAPPTRCPKPSPERGINHTSPWGRHGVRPTAAVPRARMNRRHTRSHPEPKASGIPAHGSTMGEKSAPPTRCPKPSPERGIHHTSPWGRYGVRPTAAVARGPRPTGPDERPPHPIPPRAEGIRYTSPWFNHGRIERTANPLPQAKPRTGHHTYQPVGNPRVTANAHRSSSNPEPKASGIPAHGTTMGETKPHDHTTLVRPRSLVPPQPHAALQPGAPGAGRPSARPEPKASGIPAMVHPWAERPLHCGPVGLAAECCAHINQMRRKEPAKVRRSVQ
jgi:hypothetical protein